MKICLNCFTPVQDEEQVFCNRRCEVEYSAYLDYIEDQDESLDQALEQEEPHEKDHRPN